MTVRSTFTRRALTVVAVAVSLLIGFGAIRASAAWTSSAAPLTVAPVAPETLQTRLAAETARSADLVGRLDALTAHADELTAALAAAEARIGADAGHADELAKELAAAKQKLATLEKQIKQASRTQVVVAPATTKATSGTSSDDEVDYEDDEEQDDD